jgi:hypothetical protein
MRKNFALALMVGMTATIANAQVCTIGSIISKGSPCETSAVLGLTKQIAAELNNMGIAFSPISGARISCTGGCSGYI